MTYQIIYSSESSTPMQVDDLEDLLEQAQDRNATIGITGALVYVEGFFLQILEGERASVTALMAKIARDVRHETVTILQECEIPAAVFKDWKMAYVSATSEQVARWAGLRGTTEVPQILSDIRQDAHRAARVTEGILASLLPDKTTPSKTD